RDALVSRSARYAGSGRPRHLSDDTERPPMTLRLLALMLAASATLGAQVSFDRILRAPSEPRNWLTYSGNLQGHRHSPLTQVTPANVRNLELVLAVQAPLSSQFVATHVAL